MSRMAPAGPSQRASSFHGTKVAPVTAHARRARTHTVNVVARDFPKPNFEEADTFQEAAALSASFKAAPRPAEPKVIDIIKISVTWRIVTRISAHG